MKQQIARITEQDLHGIIKEVVDGILNTNTDNTLDGGDEKLKVVIDFLENWEWVIDQVGGNLIYAHLEDNEGLKIVVEVEDYRAKLKEVHIEDISDYGIDTSVCIDLNTLIEKLEELDF